MVRRWHIAGAQEKLGDGRGGGGEKEEEGRREGGMSLAQRPAHRYVIEQEAVIVGASVC